MNKMKKISALLVSGLLLLHSNFTIAQTKDDATNAYNRGVELASTDLPKAVEALIEAVDIAEKAGDEAADILQLASQQIPLLQYNYSTSLYKEKKLDESIAGFILARDYSVKYKDESTKAKAEELLPKLYLSKGNGEMKDNKLAEALESFDKALAYDSSFSKAYLLKGIVFKKQNKFDEMKAAMDKAIETGTASNDDKTVASASKTVSDDYIINANSAFKKGNFSEVISLLDESVKYVADNPEAYYLYALANNKLSKWDDAITSAEKGMSLDENTPEKQARFYFEMGMAQSGKNDTGAACASFKKAAVGPLAESANYQIKTVLKCN